MTEPQNVSEKTKVTEEERKASRVAVWLSVGTLLVSITGNILQYQKNLTDTDALAAQQSKNQSDASLASAQVEKWKQEVASGSTSDQQKRDDREKAKVIQHSIDGYLFEIRKAEMRRDFEKANLKNAKEHHDPEAADKSEIEMQAAEESIKNFQTLLDEAKGDLSQIQKSCTG